MENCIKKHKVKNKKVKSMMKAPKVLIVEDESIIATDIQYILENSGFHVSDIVSTGEESIERASRMHPDVILMDIKLKGKIDGISAAENIYKQFRIPIVYVSAYGDERTIKKFKSIKCYGFLNKPFDENELKTVIEAALTKNRRLNN